MKRYLIVIILAVLATSIWIISKDNSAENLKFESIKMNISAQDSIPIFFIYGELAPVDYLDDENPITENYGFKLKRVAGCEISRTLVNKIHRQNQKALKEMNEKYGNNWIGEFEKKTKYKLAIPFD